MHETSTRSPTWRYLSVSRPEASGSVMFDRHSVGVLRDLRVHRLAEEGPGFGLELVVGESRGCRHSRQVG